MDTDKETAAGLPARELAEQPRALGEPRCPQFRVHHAEQRYPVQGTCVLAGWPGWFMIPSIAEYREYCTTPRFSQCCWFSGAAGTMAPSEGRPGGPATVDEAWGPPEVRGTLAA